MGAMGVGVLTTGTGAVNNRESLTLRVAMRLFLGCWIVPAGLEVGAGWGAHRFLTVWLE